MEIQKKNYLRHLASWTKDLDKKIATMRKQIVEKEEKKDKLATEIDSHSRDMSKRTSEIDKSIQNLKIIYESKENERKSLEEAIRRRKEILNESNLKLRDLESQITIMELNLQMQESNYNMKVDRRDAIKQHLEDLKASEETLRMTVDDQDVKIGLIDELIKKSIFLKDGEGRNSLIDENAQENETEIS
jgi:chromosome segregation ATPase